MVSENTLSDFENETNKDTTTNQYLDQKVDLYIQSLENTIKTNPTLGIPLDPNRSSSRDRYLLVLENIINKNLMWETESRPMVIRSIRAGYLSMHKSLTEFQKSDKKEESKILFIECFDYNTRNTIQKGIPQSHFSNKIKNRFLNLWDAIAYIDESITWSNGNLSVYYSEK